MIDDPNKTRLELATKLHDLIEEFTSPAVGDPEMAFELLLLSYQVFAFQMGYLDKLCEVIGVTDEVRGDVILSYSKAGREMAQRSLDKQIEKLTPEINMPKPKKTDYLN